MACVTSKPVVQSQSILCPRPEGDNRGSHYRHQCKESVWGRRLQCVTVTEPPPRQFWKFAYSGRGFKTIPAFSVSFFKHGANLGFQFYLPTKCSIQKCPGAFSSGVASTNLKRRSRKVSFKQHPKHAEKRALVKWIDVPQNLFVKQKIKCCCLPWKLVSCTLHRAKKASASSGICSRFTRALMLSIYSVA